MTMVVRVVIAGETQCVKFVQIILVADHLAKTLPNFCYERIEKTVLEWKQWLLQMNLKYKWSHIGSPLIWKELLMKGSKPYYIGGPSEFFDYCHSYYEFDSFIANSEFKGLLEIYNLYSIKLKNDKKGDPELTASAPNGNETINVRPKNDFIVCISGGGYLLATYIISQLLELSVGSKSISKIFIYDRTKYTKQYLKCIENECRYIETNYPGKVVIYVEKVGIALTYCDLFIILDHVPFEEDMAIGDWLKANSDIMEEIGLMLNASASRDLHVLLPNLGPACYNATILMKTARIEKTNIVVATSDLGLEVAPIAAEIAEIPMRNMFCPPVWGFVGINHLVDIRTTIHKYNTFQPYKRYTRVRNSTLNIGSLTPELRTLEYLLFFDNTLWAKVLENRKLNSVSELPINKAISLTTVAKLWLFGPDPDEIVCLGIKCNGAFGLNFEGIFSQPARYVNGMWEPAETFLVPRDSQMKLPYLEEMARYCMNIHREELPGIKVYTPCICNPKKSN